MKEILCKVAHIKKYYKNKYLIYIKYTKKIQMNHTNL